MLRTYYNQVVPMPPPKTHHIIWNLVLSDKELELTPQTLADENIQHIFAILPSTAEYLKLSQQIPDCPYTVLEYGDTHEPSVDFEKYKECGQMIDNLARQTDRKNVLVFCNNGYQRSLPLLAYYLTQFHKDEIPTIEKAVSVILAQVDKANYDKLTEMTESISRLLNHNQ